MNNDDVEKLNAEDIAYTCSRRHIQSVIEDLIECSRGWIDVHDSLPKIGEMVLVYGRLYGSSFAFDMIDDDPYEGLSWAESGSDVMDDLISHWMPLPAAPKLRNAKEV